MGLSKKSYKLEPAANLVGTPFCLLACGVVSLLFPKLAPVEVPWSGAPRAERRVEDPGGLQRGVHSRSWP